MIRIILLVFITAFFLQLFFCTNAPDKPGTLFISTTPVYSEVRVDGKTQGRTPLNLELPKGEYTVAFSPVDGFQKPADTTISLDDSTILIGQYKGLLLDTLFNIVPSQGSLWVFGTVDKPQKNGTIYDHIDGAAVPFITYGYEMTLWQGFKDTAGRVIKLEFYYMQDENAAAMLFNDSTLRTDMDSLVNIGTKGYVYHPVPEYMLIFVRSRFYVKFLTYNDYAAGDVNLLAECLDKRIQQIKP
jgi:hypothetical protein